MSEMLSSTSSDETPVHRSIPDENVKSSADKSVTYPVTDTLGHHSGSNTPETWEGQHIATNPSSPSKSIAEHPQDAMYHERTFMQPRPATIVSADPAVHVVTQSKLSTEAIPPRPASTSSIESTDFDMPQIEDLQIEDPTNITLPGINVLKATQLRTWSVMSEILFDLVPRENDTANWISQFSPDFKHLAIGCEDGVVECYNVEKGRLLWTFEINGNPKIVSIVFNRSSSKFACVTVGHGVGVWNLKGNLVQSPVLKQGVGLIDAVFAWRQEKEVLLTVQKDMVAFWKETVDNTEPNILRSASAIVHDVLHESDNIAISADSRVLAIKRRHEKPEIALIDPVRDRLLTKVSYEHESNHDDQLQFALAPHGALMACTHGNQLIQLCHIRRRKILHTFSVDVTFLRALAFSPDSRTLAAVSADSLHRHVSIWDCSTGKGIILAENWYTAERVGSKAGRGEGLQHLFFSPTGDIIILGVSAAGVTHVHRYVSAEQISRIFDEESESTDANR